VNRMAIRDVRIGRLEVDELVVRRRIQSPAPTAARRNS
jgi:hypothetical protein